MTRLALHIPPYCASCFQHPDDVSWVDFEASYDGPVIPGSPANIPVDDLIICENCLRHGATLIGMVHNEEAEAKVKELEARVAELEEEIPGKDRLISHLERTVAEAIDHPIKRGHGKPAFKGPESHAPELAQMRKNRVAREKASKKRRKVSV